MRNIINFRLKCTEIKQREKKRNKENNQIKNVINFFLKHMFNW